MSRGRAPQGTVSALKRGIAVLQCFGGGARALSNSELSVMTRVPKPTVTRLAATLVSIGLMQQDPETEKYALGPGVLSLAQAFLSGLDVRDRARPHLRHLAEKAGGSVFLGVRDGLEMVLVEACRARAPLLTLQLDVGSRVPLATSALGRAHLAALKAGEREALLEQLRQAGGTDWPRAQAALEASLRDAERFGYCVSVGELRTEVNAVAASLALPGGEWMAVNCGGPSSSFTERRLRDEIAPLLRETTAAIARDIGGAAATAH